MASQLILTPKNQQTIFPKAIQGLQVLALPVTGLDEFLENILLENPLIELDYQRDRMNSYDTNASKEYLDSVPSGYQKKNDFMDTLASGERCLSNVPESETLHGFLKLQLLLSNLTKIEKIIGEEIIGNISHDGYFVGELCEITYHYGLAVSVGEKVLNVIQTFSPLGVGARSVEECLMLQVNPHIVNYKKIKEIIYQDLEDLAERRITKLSKKHALSNEQVQEVLDYIRTLNPRPGNEFEHVVTTNYIIPDIIVKRNDCQFSIYVNDENQPSVSLNEHYLKMLRNKKVKHEEKDYIRGKCNEARILIRSLEMRYKTLKQLALFILEAQYPFFEHGPNALQPLMMQQAADAMGLHVSTISRACQEKYIQTPWGMFPLKYFFTSSFTKKTTGNVTAIQIKALIKSTIEKEDSLNPLSDCEIMERLNGLGISISRRTVAKYRQAIGIEGQQKRKRFC